MHDEIPYNPIIVQEEEPELWDFFSALSFPEQKWRIKNLIPHAGLVILAGASTEGKSWIAMEMAKAMAFGTPFLGNFETEKSTVLYINQEMAKSELHRRGRLLGMDGNFGRLWVLNRNEFMLDDENNVDWLIEFVQQKQIEVVIIDTFRAVAGAIKDENANEISQFFQRFKVLKENGVALIFLDHTRKPERFDGKIPKREQLFGSQYKLGAAEVLLMVKKGSDKGESSLYQLKNRLGVELEPFKLTMKDVEVNGKTAIEFSYLGTFEEKDSKKDEAKEFILNVLVESGKTRQECLDMALKERNIGYKNTSDALRELEDEAKIKVNKQGRKNFYQLPTEVVEEISDNLFN